MSDEEPNALNLAEFTGNSEQLIEYISKNTNWHEQPLGIPAQTFEQNNVLYGMLGRAFVNGAKIKRHEDIVILYSEEGRVVDMKGWRLYLGVFKAVVKSPKTVLSMLRNLFK